MRCILRVFLQPCSKLLLLSQCTACLKKDKIQNLKQIGGSTSSFVITISSHKQLVGKGNKQQYIWFMKTQSYLCLDQYSDCFPHICSCINCLSFFILKGNKTNSCQHRGITQQFKTEFLQTMQIRAQAKQNDFCNIFVDNPFQ